MPPLTRQIFLSSRKKARQSGSRPIGLAVLALLSVTGGSSWADPPEEKVWKGSPNRLEIGRFGPADEPISSDVYSDVYYVSSQSGSDESGDGGRDRPWKTLSHALGVAASAREENRTAILVGEGTYPETPVRMIPKVDLYGGFDEESWERKIWNHSTILDGELERRVVEGANDARLDGFHIVRGRTRSHGAGILCYRTSPRLFNNILRDNRTLEPEGFVHDPSRRRHMGNDGGGIACVDGAHPEIAHNLIHENGTEVGQGGGIACLNDSCPKIVYNFVFGNKTGTGDEHDTRTSNGGGISCFAGCLPIVSNNLIANNSAGGRSDGGGIYCEYDGSPEVAFNYILGNVAGDDGGGMEIMKGSYPRVDSNFVVGNRTRYPGGGGGLRVADRGLGEIANNLIAANSRSGVVCSNAWMNLTNNTIVHNFGEGKAYGLYFENEHWAHFMPPNIRNNLIWSNRTLAETFFDKLPTESHPAPVLAANWVDRDDEPSGTNGNGKDPGIDDRWLLGAVRSLTPRADRFVTEVAVDEDNLSHPELTGRPVRVGSQWSVLVATSQRGFEVWGWIEDATDYAVLPTYRLLAGSPCIDRGQAEGSPPTDFEGDPRSAGNGSGAPVDIGYDEFVAYSQ